MKTRSSFRFRPEAEKPREKLRLYGEGALSEAELLAIILRTGASGISVLELSERMLNFFGGLSGVLNATLEELQNVEGVGLAKACQIVAVAEILRRVQRNTLQPEVKISNPLEAYRILKGVFSAEREEVYVLLLDARGHLMGLRKVGQGTLNEAPFYPREIIAVALKANASRIIISHNHLSGDPFPSVEDEVLTKKLKRLASEMGVRLDDHIIVGKKCFYSFSRRGILEEG
ncbi:MAG: DNA repair protein RadC [Synergistetes bacterium]|nr:DNA repair protein RadC [Synergistota bacterium]